MTVCHQEIPTQDIFGGAVRQVRLVIPMRNTGGPVQQSLECNISLRQPGGVNRRVYVSGDVSRVSKLPNKYVGGTRPYG